MNLARTCFGAAGAPSSGSPKYPHEIVRVLRHKCRISEGRDTRVLRLTTHSRDSSVGIVTRYGLDGPGIESRWGARFSAPVQTGPGAHPVSCTMGTGCFPGGKAAGAWR
jgi:hypothetical protein